MKIVILDASAANPGDLSWEAFEKMGDLTVYDITTPEQLVDRACDADVCLTNKTVFSRSVLEKLPKLKYIGVLATGYNVVDLEYCREHNIAVTNVPEYATFATAQMAIALMLEFSNRVGLHSDSVNNGDWVASKQFCYWKSPLTELCGKTLAVIGFGKIGQRVALIAKALGMNVIAVPHTLKGPTIFADNVEFSTSTIANAFKTADFISFHCPLTEETRGLLNSENLNSCEHHPFIINTARGPIAVESDVSKALTDNVISGYACDVVSVEPMLENNPLLTAPNTIITPHIAWAPKETRERLISVASSNLASFVNGRIVNRVEL